MECWELSCLRSPQAYMLLSITSHLTSISARWSAFWGEAPGTGKFQPIELQIHGAVSRANLIFCARLAIFSRWLGWEKSTQVGLPCARRKWYSLFSEGFSCVGKWRAFDQSWLLHPLIHNAIVEKQESSYGNAVNALLQKYHSLMTVNHKGCILQLTVKTACTGTVQ